MVRSRDIPARIVHAWLAGNAGFAAGPGQRLPGGSTHHVLVLPRERGSQLVGLFEYRLKLIVVELIVVAEVNC